MLCKINPFMGVTTIVVTYIVLNFIIRPRNNSLYNMLSCFSLSIGISLLALEDRVFIIFAVIFVFLTFYYYIEYIKKKK